LITKIAVHRERSVNRPATSAVHPVWWVAPRPSPVSPSKYSLNVTWLRQSGDSEASTRLPSDGKRIEASESPLWRKHVTFSEYFDGDTGEGLGATHQTGWTALVAGLLTDRSR